MTAIIRTSPETKSIFSVLFVRLLAIEVYYAANGRIINIRPLGGYVGIQQAYEVRQGFHVSHETPDTLIIALGGYLEIYGLKIFGNISLRSNELKGISQVVSPRCIFHIPGGLENILRLGRYVVGDDKNAGNDDQKYTYCQGNFYQ